MSAALEAGLRESGVCAAAKRPVVTLRCSIRMEVPVATDGQWIVPLPYLEHLVKARRSADRTACDAIGAAIAASWFCSHPLPATNAKSVTPLPLPLSTPQVANGKFVLNKAKTDSLSAAMRRLRAAEEGLLAAAEAGGQDEQAAVDGKAVAAAVVVGVKHAKWWKARDRVAPRRARASEHAFRTSIECCEQCA